jgi:hypothetical protein
MMMAVCTSEMSVYSETTWQYIPEGSNLHLELCLYVLYFYGFTSYCYSILLLDPWIKLYININVCIYVPVYVHTKYMHDVYMNSCIYIHMNVYVCVVNMSTEH